ncbi:MAG: winged helix-turn-helix domain-containing protein [Bacteroidales bacterium]|jgi:hypothetical protein|nr:winged helix-turn-helix domain-containing protein [Bacteroidales bacterium]
MARIKDGILGGISGKIGNIVGANRQATSYIRSLPRIVNPKTPKQTAQRNKFAIAIKLMRPLTPILKQGWKIHAHPKSTFNAAVSHTIQNVITGTAPNFQVNYQNIIISIGDLPLPKNLKIKTDNGILTLTWSNNSNTENAQPTDKLLLALINPTKNQTTLVYNQATRANKKHQINLNPWLGNTIHAYIAFISNNQTQTSNTIPILNIPINVRAGSARPTSTRPIFQTNPNEENDKINLKNDKINDNYDKIKLKNNKINDNINEKLSAILRHILHFINENPNANIAQIEQYINKSQATVCRHLKILKNNNLIEHIGSNKTGGYHIKLPF